MAQELRANTAVDVLIGPFVEDGDGDTPTTGLTLDVELSKNGQGLADKNDATDPVHDSGGTVDGYYNCELDDTDTNTEGTLTLVVHHADALPIRHDYMVLAEGAWDSKYSPNDDGLMDVNVSTIDADAITASALNADAAAEIVDAWEAQSQADPTGFHVNVMEVNGTSQTANDNSADINAILADTNELQTDDIPGDIAGLNDLSAADVNAQVDAAIETYHLDHLLAVTYDPASKPGTADALLNEIFENDGGVSRYTANALENASGSGATAVEVRTEMDSNSTQLAAIVADTNELQTDDIPGDIAALPTAAENRAEMDSNSTQLAAIVADTNELQTDDIPADIAALPTAAENRAEMDSNSTQLAAIVADTNELQTDDIPGDIAAVDAKIDTIDGIVDAIVADTNELQTDDIPGDIAAVDAKIDTIDGIVDAIVADTNELQTDDIPSLLPAALVSGRMSSDAVSISGSTDAADKLEAASESMVIGAAEAGTLSTTQMTSDLTEVTDDHYNGRLVIWTSGVLLRQASDITDYSGATGLLTFTAVTEAPSAADTFVIV